MNFTFFFRIDVKLRLHRRHNASRAEVHTQTNQTADEDIAKHPTIQLRTHHDVVKLPFWRRDTNALTIQVMTLDLHFHGKIDVLVKVL